MHGGAPGSGAPLGNKNALTHGRYMHHERTKAELKSLVPKDAKEAIRHGVRAKRSKSGAISFDLVAESSHAAV